MPSPESVILLFGLGTLLFVSTNIDDIVLIVAFLADRRYSTPEITAGQLAGMAVLFAASLAASMVSMAVAPDHVAWLGLLPIALGVKGLVELIRGDDDDDEEEAAQASRSSHGAAGAAARVATVTAVTVANGGDNLGVYIPVFAVRSSSEVAFIGVVFLVLTIALCLAGHWLVNHSAFSEKIRRYARWGVPFVLIAIGAWILIEPRLE